MSTAVASIAPPLAPPRPQLDNSPKSSYPTIAPSNQATASNERKSSASATPSAPVVISEGAAQQKISPDGKRSPLSARQGQPPKIIVKKEPPSSPEGPTTARHRPRKLDLTSSTPQSQGSASITSRPSAPLTARESGSLGMHDVGLACLSPGFQTQDPNMREQLQRSISVRDQQRHIIESRLQKTAKPSENGERTSDLNPFGSGLKTPMTSKKRPPPGLSIVPPSHTQFENERVIQSAPLHQSFTGRHQPNPLTRHVANQPSNLSSTSHIHHVPANQTQNRLPPIADVIANQGLGIDRDNNSSSTRPNFYHSNSTSNSSHSNHRPAFPSPGLPPPNNTSTHHGGPLSSTRPREYRSAEEAVAEMAGGREDLLPKIVHYGGHQPPTPPSPHGTTPHKHSHHVPLPQHQPQQQYLQQQHQPLPQQQTIATGPEALTRSGSGRRRGRAEYERDMGTPPLGSGPESRRGPFGQGVDSPETSRRKKEEFLGLCARAWELFHS